MTQGLVKIVDGLAGRGGMTTPQSRWVARERAARVAAGKCADCGAEADGYRCDTCREIEAAWQRKRRELK